MAKKNPFVVLILVMLTFAAIALLNSSIAGYSVYGKMGSLFSGNALSALGPAIILAIIFGGLIFALRQHSK